MSDTVYELGKLRLYRRGSIYHIRGTQDGQLIRASTGSGDLRVARLVLNDVYAELQSGWRQEDSSNISWKRVANWVCARQRVAARVRSIPFDLIPTEVYDMLIATNFRCSISGIDLARKVGPNATPDPWGASIDRIECRHGYLKDNVRIVCLAANVSMNRWGYDTLLRLSKAIVRNSVNVTPEEKLTQCVSKNGHLPNEIK